METVFENPYIFMTTKPISAVQDLMPLLNVVMKEPRPLVILAEKVDGAALGMLVHNASHGTLEAVAVRSPGFGHRRIAHLQGPRGVHRRRGDHRGGRPHARERPPRVPRQRAARDRHEHSCTFVEGAGTRRGGRRRGSAQIRKEAERAPHENDREVARERLAKLASKLAVIHVGAATDVVLNEKRHRTEGALAATRAAVAEGIVPGGGTALLRAERALDDLELEGDYAIGAELVRRVLSEPLFWIATNAGYDGQAVVDQVRAMPEGAGLNALTGEFGDLIESGVIDPVRVTRLTIENAASVAALLLTTEAVVAEELIAQPGAIIAPGFGDLAEGLARPSSPV